MGISTTYSHLGTLYTARGVERSPRLQEKPAQSTGFVPIYSSALLRPARRLDSMRSAPASQTCSSPALAPGSRGSALPLLLLVLYSLSRLRSPV